MERTNDLDTASKRVAKLLLGAKSPVPLPWGGLADKEFVNVMDFVRAADSASPGVMDTYQFLCDACHPCYLQHSYLLFAGAEYGNWSNPLFAAHAHKILEQSLEAAEFASKGIASTGVSIFRRLLPTILADQTSE